mgnify:CR=1 FL=1
MVLDNFRPGVLERFGIDDARLHDLGYAPSVSIDEERKKNNDFTDGYFEISQSLLVRKGYVPTSDSQLDALVRQVDRDCTDASIEALRAARALASIRESAYQPKLEARLRAGAGKNFEGVRDQRNDTTAEVVLNWNLFNGGADQAAVALA